MNKGHANDNSTEDLVELSQLRWHCRRGVKELDVVLTNYLEKHYLKSEKPYQEAFKYFINLEDPILMALVFDEDSYDENLLQNEAQQSVMTTIKNPFLK